MKFKLLLIAILLPGLSAIAQRPPATALESFFKLDLPAAMRQAEAVLARDPQNASALFARMEAAELQGQTSVVLDSALRICAIHASPALLEVASGRIFRHAGNTQAFHAVLRRVNAEVQQETGCAENLRLALVAAAADGDPDVDLDHTASAAGLLTRWRVAGPFGRYSNADFDRKLEPERDQFSHSVYGKLKTEEFRFRDGSILLPDYFPGAGVFYASSDVEISRRQESVVEVFGAGPYCLFVDGKLALVHDSRLALKSARDSSTVQLLPGKHRVMIKFTLDAEPLQVAVHAQVQHRERQAPLVGPLKN